MIKLNLNLVQFDFDVWCSDGYELDGLTESQLSSDNSRLPGRKTIPSDQVSPEYLQIYLEHSNRFSILVINLGLLKFLYDDFRRSSLHIQNL